MKVEHVDPNETEIDPDSVLFTARVFQRDAHGVEVGVHMQGKDDLSDAQLLELCEVLTEILGGSMENLRRSLVHNALATDRKMRNARLRASKGEPFMSVVEGKNSETLH